MTTPRRRLAIIAFIALLLLIAAFGSRLWRSVAAPWSISSNDPSTLNGAWSGTLELADGTTGMIWLNFVDTVDEMEGFGSPNLEGTARYCLGSFQGEFELYGAADRDGSITDLRFSPEEEKPVWLLYIDDGRWQGEILTINGRYSYDPTGQHISRSDQPEPELTMVLQMAEEETGYEAFTEECR